MNSRNEKATAGMRELDQLDDRRQPIAVVEWARKWREGNALCPLCGADEFDLLDIHSAGQMRYETLRCKAGACRARWRVEFREAALAVLGGDVERESSWIELHPTDELQSVMLTERETAVVLAALRLWQREGHGSLERDRDILTDIDHLWPLAAEQVDALCQRFAGPKSDFSKS